MEILLILVLSIIPLCIFYYIIKAAVREGIKESIEDMKLDIKNEIKMK